MTELEAVMNVREQGAARASARQAKATKCSPVRVVVRRSSSRTRRRKRVFPAKLRSMLSSPMPRSV